MPPFWVETHGGGTTLPLVETAVPRFSSAAVSSAAKFRSWKRRLTDKIGVGAGGDIVVATSTTQVWCTHTPTKSVSAPARQSIS